MASSASIDVYAIILHTAGEINLTSTTWPSAGVTIPAGRHITVFAGDLYVFMFWQGFPPVALVHTFLLHLLQKTALPALP